MTHLTINEWDRVQVGDNGFSRQQADILLASARAHALGGIDGTNILCDHHRFLRARQAVGVIAGRGCSLEILPKVDPNIAEENAGTVRARLVHMLDTVLGLNLSVGEISAMAHQAKSLLEVFISIFADRLLSEVRRGLPRQYKNHEDDLCTLRGQLNVIRQFTAHAVRPDRLACRFDVLDVDIPLMQIMKACVKLLTRYARSIDTKRKLAELHFLFADVSDVSVKALPWNRVQIDRSSRRWRALVELARLLFGSRWQQTHVDIRAPEGISLLFPMNDLFERYVAVQVRHALANTTLEVTAQSGGEYCLGNWKEGQAVVGNSHRTRPDILIKHQGRVVAVLDTKWKHIGKGISHADIYQMMAYARLYKCDRLILLYPAAHGELADHFETRGIPPGDDRLDIATLQLANETATVRASLRRLIANAINPREVVVGYSI